MKNYQNGYWWMLALFTWLTAGSCKKYLEEKPSSKLTTPQTVADFQALLDNYALLNMNSPASLEISADSYYLIKDDYDRLGDDLKRMVIWEADYLFEGPPNDWSNIYRTVNIANTVLENKAKLTPDGKGDDVLGQAYLWRAFSFLKAAFIWTPTYDIARANEDAGIPLRLNTNFNEPSVRASVRETYERIISDLNEAIRYLPPSSIHVMRPSKAAAHGLLARTYLAMRQYDSVYKYAELGLKLRSNPQDYNDVRISPSATFPFSAIKYNNADIIFHSAGPPTNVLAVTRGRIDSGLYNSYHINDLRKTVFFRRLAADVYGFKGSYEGGNSLFAGVSVSELLLMRAEAACRLGLLDVALPDINHLLVHRFRTGSFTPLNTDNPQELLAVILQERRKELLMRGLRWMDLKRLNKEGAGIVLTREIDQQVFVLPPGDLRYALPLPEDVIALSGMEQNPR